MVQAGLLTFGSSYRLRLPSLSASDIKQLSFPITAAGPSPIHTGFPIKLCAERLRQSRPIFHCGNKKVKKKFKGVFIFNNASRIVELRADRAWQKAGRLSTAQKKFKNRCSGPPLPTPIHEGFDRQKSVDIMIPDYLVFF